MGRGMGGGRGMGRGGGRGMGRGMGGGRGMGMGGGVSGGAPIAPNLAGVGIPQQAGPAVTREQELEILKAQAQAMIEQLGAINTHIEKLEQIAVTSGQIAVVNTDNCVGCGVCQNVCPTGAIVVNVVARVDRNRCTGCGRCVAECPQNAISLSSA